MWQSLAWGGVVTDGQRHRFGGCGSQAQREELGKEEETIEQVE